jgi:hypothetical protein
LFRVNRKYYWDNIAGTRNTERILLLHSAPKDWKRLEDDFTKDTNIAIHPKLKELKDRWIFDQDQVPWYTAKTKYKAG